MLENQPVPRSKKNRDQKFYSGAGVLSFLGARDGSGMRWFGNAMVWECDGSGRMARFKA